MVKEKRNFMLKSVMTILFLFMATFSWLTAEEDGIKQNPQLFPTDLTIPEYRLGFGDMIEVKFFENERFNEAVTIRPDGRISLERMGEIFVAGMTPIQLDSMITLKYAEFIQDPDVTVIVRGFSGYKIYVLGEVNQPGGYPVEREMTLLQAIASAGGTREGAKIQSTILLRRGANNEVEAQKVDLKKAIRNGNKVASSYDLFVQPHDIVYVPKTTIASASTFMQQIYDGFLPQVDLYLRWLWWKKLD
jgi:protein involved in polysaccharide export with SLBB domain